jgi:hypothetical protein
MEQDQTDNLDPTSRTPSLPAALQETTLPHQEIVDAALATLRNSTAAANATPLQTYVEITARMPWEDMYNYLLLFQQYPSASCLGSFKQWERAGAPIRQRQKALHLVSIGFELHTDAQGIEWVVPRYGTRRLFDTGQTTKPRKYQAPQIPLPELTRSVIRLLGRYGIALDQAPVSPNQLVECIQEASRYALAVRNRLEHSDDVHLDLAHIDFVAAILARYVNLPYALKAELLPQWSQSPDAFERQLQICHSVAHSALCRLDPGAVLSL